jgi:hypothetical protein
VVSGANGTVVRGSNGVYAGNDGNVYRKDGTGSWSKYDNGSWNTVDTSAAKQQAQQNLQTNHPDAQQNFQANHPDARQNAQNVRQQGATTPTLNASGQGRSMQGVSPSTMDNLNRSAESRQRGQMQTQRFQNVHRGGGGGRFRR